MGAAVSVKAKTRAVAAFGAPAEQAPEAAPCDPRSVASAAVSAATDSAETLHQKRALLRNLDQIERAGWRLSRQYTERDSVAELAAELDRVLTAEATTLDEPAPASPPRARWPTPRRTWGAPPR